MINALKKIVCVFSVFLLGLFTSCSTVQQNQGLVTKAIRKKPLPEVSAGHSLAGRAQAGYRFESVAQNEVLSLGYDAENNAFTITDRRNGFSWSTVVDAREQGLQVNELWEQNLSSLFYVTYCTIGRNGQMKSNTAPIRKLEPVIWTDALQHGIRLQYYMPSLKLGFTAELTIEKNCLQIHIPAESVWEDGEILFVRLDVAPLLGASQIGSKGYYLLPDGSGSLFYLDSPRYATSYRWDAYSHFVMDNEEPDKLDYMKDVASDDYVNIYTAPLPVYGAKLGNNAFIAYAEAGDSDYSINMITGSQSVRYNRIYGQFILRHSYTFSGANTIENTRDALLYEVVDDYFIKTDRTLRYEFLCDGEADYSGMASAYRSRLTQTGLLGKQKRPDEMPIIVSFFMGAMKTGIMSGNFMAMTSFLNVQEAVEELLSQGVKNLVVNLNGWNKNGYGAFSMEFSPDTRLGGTRGLKALADFCAQNGVKLTLQTDFARISETYAPADIRGRFIKNADGKVVSDKKALSFLLNPRKSLSVFKDFSTKVSAKIQSGVFLDSIGSRVYMDYRKGHVLYRSDCIASWKEILEEAGKLGLVLVRGGNLYTLSEADIVTGLPIDSSKASVSDTAIPFLQMVLHGHIWYSSNEYNTYYDDTLQALKNIEYGAVPCFELTHEAVANLKNTHYNRLFSASFSQWKDRVTEVCAQYLGELQRVYASPMIRHDMLSDTLVRISYEDGSCLYVNYGETSETVDGLMVKGRGYLLSVPSEGGMVS